MHIPLGKQISVQAMNSELGELNTALSKFWLTTINFEYLTKCSKYGNQNIIS